MFSRSRKRPNRGRKQRKPPAGPSTQPAGLATATAHGAARPGKGRKTKRGAAAPQRSILLAWLVSVGSHVLLFVMMFLLPWLGDVVGNQDDLPIALTDFVGEVEMVRAPATPNPSLTSELPVPPTESLTFEPKRFDSLSESVTAARPELSIIGIGTGGGEDLNRFGLRTEGAEAGPSFFGLGGEARGAKRIVYVVDRSGSMMTTFRAVRQELRKSIEGLRRTQKFHVIFFNAGVPLENPAKRLVPPTVSQKRTAFEFLDTITAEGSTDPIPAMHRAFAVKPDLVYFLTDGDFDPALVDRLREWNSAKRVRVFTLAYVSEAGRVLLEQIARENNGEFKFISEHDIF